MAKPGERVGAILGADPNDGACEFLGFGVYEGDFPRPSTAGGLFGVTTADWILENMPEAMDLEFDDASREFVTHHIPMTRERAERYAAHMNRNPRIRLDSGDVVWGCQCWWGPEKVVKARLEAYQSKGIEVRTTRLRDRFPEYDTTATPEASGATS